MNSVTATVSRIEQESLLHLVYMSSGEVDLTMMALELPKELHVGSVVELGYKPSHVILALEGAEKVTISNKIPCKIISIESGKLVSVIKLDTPVGSIESLITKNSVNALALSVGQHVTALVKASELSLQKVL